MKKKSPPWKNLSDAPPLEKWIHDYIVSIYRRSTGPINDVNIILISEGAETLRGWDAAVVEVIPLYFQYKLADFTSRPTSSQSVAHGARLAWAYDDNAGLFHFRLREVAKTAPKSQHALMVDLQTQGEQVFYVSLTAIDPNILLKGGYPITDTEPWRTSEISYRMLGAGNVEHIEVPYFDNLICIPPNADVSDPPESHQIFFNGRHEVSLHSEPMRIPSVRFRNVMYNQIRNIAGRNSITTDNVDEYVNRILKLAATTKDENGDPALLASVRQYFESNLSSIPVAKKNPLMRQLRALAKTLRKLYGIELMLTAKLKPVDARF